MSRGVYGGFSSNPTPTKYGDFKPWGAHNQDDAMTADNLKSLSSDKAQVKRATTGSDEAGKQQSKKSTKSSPSVGGEPSPYFVSSGSDLKGTTSPETKSPSIIHSEGSGNKKSSEKKLASTSEHSKSPGSDEASLGMQDELSTGKAISEALAEMSSVSKAKGKGPATSTDDPKQKFKPDVDLIRRLFPTAPRLTEVMDAQKKQQEAEQKRKAKGTNDWLRMNKLPTSDEQKPLTKDEEDAKFYADLTTHQREMMKYHLAQEGIDYDPYLMQVTKKLGIADNNNDDNDKNATKDKEAANQVGPADYLLSPPAGDSTKGATSNFLPAWKKDLRAYGLQNLGVTRRGIRAFEEVLADLNAAAGMLEVVRVRCERHERRARKCIPWYEKFQAELAEFEGVSTSFSD